LALSLFLDDFIKCSRRNAAIPLPLPVRSFAQCKPANDYVDLGRFWQLFLLAGLFIWLALMTRGLWPALRRPGEHRSLLTLFLLSSVAIAGFYAAGLGIWKHTHRYEGGRSSVDSRGRARRSGRLIMAGASTPLAVQLPCCRCRGRPFL